MTTLEKTPETPAAASLTWTAFIVGILMCLVVGAAFLLGGLSDRLFVLKPIDRLMASVPALWLLGNRGSVANTSALPPTTAIDSVADVVEVAGPSVVTVAVKTQQPVLERVSPNGIFGWNFQIPSGRVEEVQRDIGTGFVVQGEQGVVVTNKHVVSDASSQYHVIDSTNNEYAVTEIYRDPLTDLAILQVEGLELPGLPLGDSEAVRVGDGVIAIGTALGEFRNTVTTGVISGKARGIDASAGPFSQTERLDNVLQTDAAINPGNSGGPLIAATGEVIGVNAAVTQGAQNVGFAIPINIVKDVIANFNSTGQFERPMLGVRYEMIPLQTALMNNVPQGALVVETVPNTAAARAGLAAGDIITKLDGVALADRPLVEIINSKKIGDTLKIEYWRDGDTSEVETTLEKLAE